MNDLFLSKSQRLWNFCQEKKLVSKADLFDWSVKNYYLSADRVIRKWVEKQIKPIRSLSKDDKIFRGLSTKMAYYEVTNGIHPR